MPNGLIKSCQMVGQKTFESQKFGNMCAKTAKIVILYWRRRHSTDPYPPHVGKRRHWSDPSPPSNCGRLKWTAPLVLSSIFSYTLLLEDLESSDNIKISTVSRSNKLVRGPWEYLDTWLPIFFQNLKSAEILKKHSNIIWLSSKVVLILKIWRVWLKN